MQRSSKAYSVNILFFIFILFGIAYTVIDPLIPVISEQLGIGFDRIGLILFASSSISLSATFFAGRFSDKYNAKKIILAGLILVFAGFLIYGIYVSLAVFVITIIFFRAGCGILDSSIHAYAAKLFHGNHSPVFIKLDFFWYTGAIIGPLVISGFLFLKIAPAVAFLIFSAVALAAIIFFILYYIKRKENETVSHVPDNKTESKQEKSGNYIQILKNPVIIFCCAGLFFYIGIFTILSTWLTTYFSELNVAVSYGSMILAAFWAFNAIGVLITQALINRKSESLLLIIYSAAGAISSTLYALLPQISVKIIFLVLQAVFYSSLFPLLNAVAVKENTRFSGTVLSITLSVCVSGLIVFQPLSGVLIEYLGNAGINYLLIFSAAATFIFIFLLYLSLKRKDRPVRSFK